MAGKHTKTRRSRIRRYPHRDKYTRRNTKDHDTLRANNFYLWANQKWINEVPKTLPRELKYIRPLDNFKLIQDEMYRNVLTMVREYTRDNSKHIISQQMKHIAASFRDLHTEPIIGHISEFCKLYNELSRENNLYKFLGVMNQNEMIKWALPVVWSLYPDEYTPKSITPHLSSPSLSLYDYRFYVEDKILEKQMRGVRLNVNKTSVIRQHEDQTGGGGPETKTIEYIKYKQRITRAFMKFIDDVFTKCLGPDYEKTHSIKAQDVYDIECLLMRLMNTLDTRFDMKYANVYDSAKHPDIQPHRVPSSS